MASTGQHEENTRNFITWSELNAYVQIIMRIVMEDLLEYISHPKPSDSSADHRQFVIGVCSNLSMYATSGMTATHAR